MRFLIRFLKWVGYFLDHRFPEKMTAEEVRVELDKCKYRITLLEDQHNKIVVQLTSLKLMSGIKTAMRAEE